MSASGCSYIGGGEQRQSPILAAVAVAALGIALGGCSSMGMPLGEAGGSYERTGAIAVGAVVTDSVDPSDWEAVRRTVARVPADMLADRVEWSNPATGSTGTVAMSEPSNDRGGKLCRPLSATINDIRGVRRYRGDACRGADGVWRLYGMTADDAILL